MLESDGGRADDCCVSTFFIDFDLFDLIRELVVTVRADPDCPIPC